MLTLCTLHSALSTVKAQGTAFTYQGLLDVQQQSGQRQLRFEFQLYNAATTNGGTGGGCAPDHDQRRREQRPVHRIAEFLQYKFHRHQLLGGNQRHHQRRHQLFSPKPLIPITPAPYAISAGTASNLLGALPLAQLPAVVVTNNATNLILGGAFSGNGAGLTNSPDQCLESHWQCRHHSRREFLGTTDSNTLQFRVKWNAGVPSDGSFDSNRPNIIGGSGSNSVAAGVYGATIAGGYKITWLMRRMASLAAVLSTR